MERELITRLFGALPNDALTRLNDSLKQATMGQALVEQNQLLLPKKQRRRKRNNNKKRKPKTKKRNQPQPRFPPRRKSRLTLEYEDYTRLVASPFFSATVPLPFSNNPQPTERFLPFRGTFTERNVTLGAGGTVWFYFFGYPNQTLNDGMDGTAYHVEYGVDASGDRYIPGLPYDTAFGGGTAYGAAGYSNLGAVCTTNMNLANALYWDTPYPMVASPANGHMRAMQIAGGVRVINKTKGANRGGEVFSFQPGTNMPDLQNIESFARLPTFIEHGIDIEKPISLIPRPDIIGYRHAGVTSTGGNQRMTRPGIVVFIANTTDSIQQYTIELVAHFMVAGDGMTSLGTPPPQHPHMKNVHEATTTVLMNSAPSAETLPRVVAHVAEAHADPGNPSHLLNAKKAATGDSFLTKLTKAAGQVAEGFGAPIVGLGAAAGGAYAV